MKFEDNMRLEFVKRTMELLDYNRSSKYEVTYMINLSLGLIVIPKEDIDKNKGSKISQEFNKLLNSLDFKALIKKIEINRAMSNQEMLRKIRNGISHGDIIFASNPYGNDIEAIKIADTEYKNKAEFEFTIEQFNYFAISIAECLIKAYEIVKKGD